MLTLPLNPIKNFELNLHSENNSLELFQQTDLEQPNGLFDALIEDLFAKTNLNNNNASHNVEINNEIEIEINLIETNLNELQINSSFDSNNYSHSKISNSKIGNSEISNTIKEIT